MSGTDSDGLPPAATGTSRHPEDPPARCSVCGEAYDAVSDHTGGLMVALAENERFDRVCFEPILDAVDDESDAADDESDAADDRQPSIRFFHH